MATINSTFQISDKIFSTTQTKKPKYLVEIDDQRFELCTADQIRAVIIDSGRYISKNGCYLELMGRERGECKSKKLAGVKISKLNRQLIPEVKSVKPERSADILPATTKSKTT